MHEYYTEQDPRHASSGYRTAGMFGGPEIHRNPRKVEPLRVKLPKKK